MTTRADIADIAVYDKQDQLVLVGEVKNKLAAAPEWAGRFRRNILAHGIYPSAPFFLFAFPDTFYLWTASHQPLEYTEPDFTIDARPLLRPYFEQAGVQPEQISESSLELIIAAWLDEIIHTTVAPEALTAGQPWLIESGLYAAIAGGRLAQEVAV
ncbi:MAG: hypothetical protein ACLFVO_09450 [Chloroflexaceae bacterium]